MSYEDDALKISQEGSDAIKSFVTGFAAFMEEKEKESKQTILKMYSEMNLPTLIYNAMIIKEELKKRNVGVAEK